MYIAIIAVLMPVAGPAIDHHFFERFAFHAHVYLGDPDLDHGHVYDSDSNSASSDSDNYIATSGDGPSTGNSTLVANDLANIDALTPPEDGVLNRPGTVIERPREIVIAQPEKPPRTQPPVTQLEPAEHSDIA